MEAYMNFGCVGGIIFFTFLGAIYRYIYEKFLAKPNFLRTVLILALTSSFTLWMRNTVKQSIRALVWSFIVALIIQVMFTEKGTSIQYDVVEDG